MKVKSKVKSGGVEPSPFRLVEPILMPIKIIFGG
jgi:hypothetical protein